jgi:hypothetical protein
MNSPALEKVCRVVLVLMGVITAGPVLALFSPGRLSGYGLDDAALDPMVLALLQHRGMLQAALGAALVWAAFQPAVRIPAALAAIATKSTFLALTLPLEILSGAVFDMVAITILAAIAFRQAWLVRSAEPTRAG